MNVVKIKEFYKEHKKEIVLGALGLGAGIICGGKIYRTVKQKQNLTAIETEAVDHICNYIDLLQYAVDNGGDAVNIGYMKPDDTTISKLGAIGEHLCSINKNISINDKIVGLSVITKKVESN